MIRQMLVVKSRGSAHSNRRQLYVITDRGIEFPDTHTRRRIGMGKAAGRTVTNEQIAASQTRARKEQRGHYLLDCSWQATDRIPKKRWPTFVVFARSTWRGVIRLKRLMWFRTFKQRSATTY